VHAHGDGQPHEHHGGAREGLAFDLLDAIMLGAFVVVCGLLAELAYKAWRAKREGVRYNLTPEGLAASEPVPTEGE
jgi:hypothetical protein